MCQTIRSEELKCSLVIILHFKKVFHQCSRRTEDVVNIFIQKQHKTVNFIFMYVSVTKENVNVYDGNTIK